MNLTTPFLEGLHRAAFYFIGGLTLAALLAGCSSTPPRVTDTRLDDVFGSGSVTVYPPAVVVSTITYDDASTPIFADFCRERTTGSVTASSEHIQGYNLQFGTPRPVWEIIRDSVRNHLAIYPLKTDYGGWTVYIFTPGTNVASDIQVMVFDNQGNIVRRFSIKQFDKPLHSPAECTNLVMSVVRQREAIAKFW